MVVLDGLRNEAAFGLLHGVALEPQFAAANLVHLSPDLPETFRLPTPRPTVGARVFLGETLVGETANPAELRELLRNALSSR